MAAGHLHVLRLDVAAAAASTGPLSFTELGSGPGGESGVIAVDPAVLGDIVLTRRDVGAAYHLAVVVDDAFQQVSLVTRGKRSVRSDTCAASAAGAARTAGTAVRASPTDPGSPGP